MTFLPFIDLNSFLLDLLSIGKKPLIHHISSTAGEKKSGLAVLFGSDLPSSLTVVVSNRIQFISNP
jgi:hypothetical protein